MNTVNPKVTLSLAVSLALCVLITPAEAEKRQVSGTDIAGPVISETKSNPGGVPGHEIIQRVTHYTTTSSDPELDGTQGISYMQLDSTGGTGSHRGYAVQTYKNGDKDITYNEGTHTLTIMDDGSWEANWEGTWKVISGTGKFENMKGSGTYKGKGTPKGSSTDWVGEKE